MKVNPNTLSDLKRLLLILCLSLALTSPAHAVFRSDLLGSRAVVRTPLTRYFSSYPRYNKSILYPSSPKSVTKHKCVSLPSTRQHQVRYQAIGYIHYGGHYNYARYSALYALGALTGIATSAYISQNVHARGYRGDHGFCPYNCSWGDKCKQEIKEALVEAEIFGEVIRNNKALNEGTQKQIGIRILVNLLLAQAQLDYLIHRHNGMYFCCIAGRLTCHQLQKNFSIKNSYSKILETEISYIRYVIRTIRPPRDEDKALYFLIGTGQTLIMALATGSAVSWLAGLPGIGPILLIGAGTGAFAYQIVSQQETVEFLKAEEKRMMKEMFFKAMHHDEHCKQSAQEWGSYIASWCLMLYSWNDLMSSKNLEEFIRESIQGTLEGASEDVLAEGIEAVISSEAGGQSEQEFAKKLNLIVDNIEKAAQMIVESSWLKKEVIKNLKHAIAADSPIEILPGLTLKVKAYPYY